MDRKNDGNQNAAPNPQLVGAGAATAPGEAVPPQEGREEGLKKEYAIDIFRDWCKGCGICAEFCPKKCIRMNEAGEPVVERADRCTGCRWCELHCPDFAICVREVAAKKAAEEVD